MATDPSSTVSGLVDHLFRRKAGQMVSALTRLLGPANLELAEEVVQDALLKALQTWPTNGVPDNPGGWLVQVAKNHAIDRLRRENRYAEKLEVLTQQTSIDPEARLATWGSEDDELRMLLLCCHPALSREGRGALTLKTVGGFGVDEIARAFLTRKTTVQQRLVRAKRMLKQGSITFDAPTDDDLLARIESGLEILYLMFNEGYGAYRGDNLVRSDLCREAIRLTMILADYPETARPEVHALLALMLLQASRLPSRLDADGAVALLADQDRQLWDRSMIGAGFHHLDKSTDGSTVTTYHLQAGIAAVHAAAASHEDTDWGRILELYDRLLALNPSPVVGLNRAVALAMVEGPEAGVTALRAIEAHPALRDYYLLPATFGDFFTRMKQWDAAARYLTRALRLPCSEPEKRFLGKRLAACRKLNNGTVAPSR